MNIPESMKKELETWNGGRGIDLRSWISYEGNYSLAVGYAALFCPRFIQYGGYILALEEIDAESIARIHDIEKQEGSTPKAVEWLMNHLHLSDLHHDGCGDLTSDKVVSLGTALKEVYEARLKHLFPGKPCIVEFYKPKDTALIDEYQLTFWQRRHGQ